jgi:predicted amidohydrolase YtcJ
MPAGLILTDARIHTMDELCPYAEAMAVRDDRIVAVGSAAEVLATAIPGSRVLDLGGRTVLPGLIDAHVHLLDFALQLERVDLAGVNSLAEAVRRVGDAAAKLPAGDWIQGGGWDKNQWGRLPTRWDLDAVAPNHPVLLISKDMHSAWVNSLALSLAGVTGDTSDPAGGEVVRQAGTGEPTGLLRENGCRLVVEVVPEPSIARCDRAAEEAIAIAASRGVTGLHVPEMYGASFPGGSPNFSLLRRLKERDALSLRVLCHLSREALPDLLRQGVRTGDGDEWLRVGPLKLFLDGALGSQTAHMLEPYGGGNGGVGIETLTREQLRELLIASMSGGIAPAIHAIGDAANRKALDLLEETVGLWRPRGLRPRIEHAQLLHPADAQRLGILGIVASMQPSHQPSDWLIADRYWAGRNDLAYAWRTILESGAVLAFGSDCPVEPLSPLAGMFAAVTRQTVDGQPVGGWHPEQRLTPLEALRGFTLGAAFASGEESVKGSLSAGKLADFVVLSDDPITGDPRLFLSTKVEATAVGGRVIYGEL